MQLKILREIEYFWSLRYGKKQSDMTELFIYFYLLIFTVSFKGLFEVCLFSV